MKRLITLTICAPIAFYTLLLIFQKHKTEQFSVRTFSSFVEKWKFKSSVKAPSLDYILNNSQQIKLPLHCVPMSTIRGEIPICVHDNPNEVISYQLRKTGSWESEHSRSLQNILVANPDYGFIDIGANLGMFSLQAANLHRPSLAVEAADINTEKFHQSIVINQFEKYITVVNRPLSDKYESVHISAGKSNLGRARIAEYLNRGNALDSKTVSGIKRTIMLDDLIDLMPRKKAIMVIDVEGNEGRVIRGGEKFFDTIHISHVFIEWFHLSQEDQEYLVNFFSKRGYKPYSSPSFVNKLDWSKYTEWPINIFLRK